MRNEMNVFHYGFACSHRSYRALVAEIEAAIVALSCVEQSGYTRITTESNSKVLIDTINGKSCVKAWTILSLLDEIRLLCSSFTAVE
ncbi:hypothetical protein ACE6H2_001381 [Prunus campanulata]